MNTRIQIYIRVPLKKDKNCEKPVKELFLETLQLRLGNNSKEISEKNYTEK